MDFERLDLTELDKDLSEEQRKEWNAIYASYRSRSVLTGRVAGMDITSVTLKNQETGDLERKEINCLVVIEYRVKILIPEQEIWFDEKTRRPSMFCVPWRVPLSIMLLLRLTEKASAALLPGERR